MGPQTVRWVFSALGGAVLFSCTSYEPQALVPAEIVERVNEQRHAPAGDSRESGQPVLTLALAAQWMRTHGPAVREAVAAYETALARARIETPFPNPGLEVGPQWGFGSDAEPATRVAPFGSIGFSIPLGGRLARQDELNQALAEVARIEGVARYRELYLELRSRYMQLVIARERERLQSDLSEAARKTVAVARQLIEAGTATAVDLALFELEHARRQAAVLEAAHATTGSEADLSELIGVHAGLFSALGQGALPSLPTKPQDLESLRGLLVAHHPALGRLRARYEAAERALRLEIARQYPDLQLGTSYTGETGEDQAVIGLSLGIELPLFDRNQQAIAEAAKRREEVRAQYEAAVNRALAELEGALRSVELTTRRGDLLRNQVLPRATESMRIARESLSAGSGDALRLLDAERSQRELRVEQLDAELEARLAWSALEQAVGFPLIPFPSEATGNAEALLPEGLVTESDNTDDEGSK